MFATSARVSPWIAQAVRRSAPRPTKTVPSASFTEQRSWTRSSRRPLGPLTSTCCPWTPIWTPFGIAIGFFPILDIVPFLAPVAARWVALPDVAEDLPAHLRLAGIPVREQPARRRQDRDPHPPEDARNAVRPDVEPPPRLRDAPEAADDPLLAGTVLQVDAEHALALVFDEAEVLDEPLLLEDLRQPNLQLRGRDVHLFVLGQTAVADARQHVCDRIRHHRHGRSPLGRLPGGLRHARDLTAQGQVPEADSAQLEFAEVPARPPAHPAPRVGAHLEFRGAPLLVDQRRLRHGSLSALLAERDAEVRQERLGFLVRRGGRADDDVHPADLVDLV